MIKKNIANLVQKEQNNLLETIECYEEERSLYDRVFKDNNNGFINLCVNPNLADWSLIILNTEIENKSILDLKKDVQLFLPIFFNTKGKDLKSLIYILNLSRENGIFERFKRDLMTNLLNKFFADFPKDYHFSKESVHKFKDYCEKYPREINNLLSVIVAIRSIREDCVEFDKTFMEQVIKTNGKISVVDKAEKKEQFLLIMIGKNNFNSLSQYFSYIMDYYEKLFSLKKKEVRNARRDFNSYEAFLKELDKIGDSLEYIDYFNLIKKIPNKRIRLEALKFVYEHNMSEYRRLEDEYSYLSNDSLNHYVAVLGEYNISKNEVSLNRIMEMDIDHIKTMLEEASSISNEKSFLINVLNHSDYETLHYLVQLSNRSVLSNDSIVRYNNLLLRNSDEFKSLKEAISCVEEYGLNPNIFINNPEAIIHNNYLKDNLLVLQQYDLIANFKDAKDYYFLTRSDLKYLIDQIIELGYEKFLIDDLSLLCEENWKRIYVLHAMNYQIEDKSDLLNYLRSDFFFIPDDELDNYIPNVVSYYQEDKEDCHASVQDIPELKDYEISSRAYEINGVILSKNRVMRYFNRNEEDTCNSLFQAMICNSILTKEDIDKLQSEIIGKILRK